MGREAVKEELRKKKAHHRGTEHTEKKENGVAEKGESDEGRR